MATTRLQNASSCPCKGFYKALEDLCNVSQRPSHTFNKHTNFLLKFFRACFYFPMTLHSRWKTFSMFLEAFSKAFYRACAYVLCRPCTMPLQILVYWIEHAWSLLPHVLVVTMFSGYDRPLEGLFTALKGLYKPLWRTIQCFQNAFCDA